MVGNHISVLIVYIYVCIYIYIYIVIWAIYPISAELNLLSSEDLLLTMSKKELINNFRASLVAQWLRICLLMQGTRVRALVWEDPTCHGAAGPVSHNC